MKIVYNDKTGKYEPITNSNEKISNLNEEDLITKFRLFKDSKFYEIHFYTNSGIILSRTEREERLPEEKIENFENENYYLKITHFIDDRGEHERVKCELLNTETNQIIGKSHFDMFPIFQTISIDPKEEKEEILNSIYPWRYYENQGYKKLQLKERITFWEYELNRMERFNSPYPLPYKNKGFNILECWYINEIYAHFEDDLKSFIIELAKSFKIDETVAHEIYENRNDKNKWENIVEKYEMNQ